MQIQSTFDLKLIDPTVATVITREWATQNVACPIREIDGQIEFATPRAGHDRKGLIVAIKELGLFNPRFAPVTGPVFDEVINKRFPDQNETFSTMTAPESARELAAVASAAIEANGERLHR